MAEIGGVDPHTRSRVPFAFKATPEAARVQFPFRGNRKTRIPYPKVPSVFQTAPDPLWFSFLGRTSTPKDAAALVTTHVDSRQLLLLILGIARVDLVDKHHVEMTLNEVHLLGIQGLRIPKLEQALQLVTELLTLHWKISLITRIKLAASAQADK